METFAFALSTSSRKLPTPCRLTLSATMPFDMITVFIPPFVKLLHLHTSFHFIVHYLLICIPSYLFTCFPRHFSLVFMYPVYFLWCSTVLFRSVTITKNSLALTAPPNTATHPSCCHWETMCPKSVVRFRIVSVHDHSFRPCIVDRGINALSRRSKESNPNHGTP